MLTFKEFVEIIIEESHGHKPKFPEITVDGHKPGYYYHPQGLIRVDLEGTLVLVTTDIVLNSIELVNVRPITDETPWPRCLDTIQRGIHIWSKRQFENNTSVLTGEPLYDLTSFTGIVEELGELARTIICSHQGRKGYQDPEKRIPDQKDALADMSVFQMDFCSRNGYNLLDLVHDTWKQSSVETK